MKSKSPTRSSAICSDLQSTDKLKRKQALKDIAREIESLESMNEGRVAELWEELHRPVVRALHDPMEACRDLALDILKKFILKLACSDKNIVYVIPIMTKRLGPQELIESSEEIRLKCVVLLRAIVQKYQEKLAAYFEDLATILARTVTDNYPKVKQESCECICELARCLPQEFHKRSGSFVKPVLSNVAHAHHKVRTTTVKTIGEVLLYGDSKLMESVAGPMAERLFDQSGAVRTAVVEVAGKWMMELKDRYSWWHKLLPLLLTGLSDVLAVIRKKATKLWMSVGEQYIVENESDPKFKEKLDFLPESLPHYPPNIVRPNLGCRTIAQQNLCKLIPAIVRELNDWMADIKVRAAQLLCIMVINVEDGVTNYVTKLLPAMYRACNDLDKRVVENVELAAEYVACFVPPNLLLDIVLPQLATGTPTRGHLKVFGGVIRGSPREEFVAMLPKIGEFMRKSDISQDNRKVRYQLDVLSVCQSLMSVCEEDCVHVAEELFSAIFTVLALALEVAATDEAKKLLAELARLERFDSLDRLYDKYIRTLLINVQTEPDSWSVISREFGIFQACIGYARSATYDCLDLIHPVFEQATRADADPKLRLKMYILLSEYFQQWDKPLEDDAYDFVRFACSALEKVVVPGLQWAAGKTAEATRTASVCCLCALLSTVMAKKSCLSVERFGWLFDQVRPLLVSLIEDDSDRTRLHALQAICLVMNIGQELSCVTEEHIHKTSPEVLARLEDRHDEVRLAAIEAVREIWKVLPKDYDLAFYCVHVDYVYSKMLTHLDDPADKFQRMTFECLMDLVKVNPELLMEKIHESRAKFINQKDLDLLIEAAQDSLKNKKEISN